MESTSETNWSSRESRNQLARCGSSTARASANDMVTLAPAMSERGVVPAGSEAAKRCRKTCETEVRVSEMKVTFTRMHADAQRAAPHPRRSPNILYIHILTEK